MYLYTVTERFGPWDGNRWREYAEFAKLPQLREVITLDTLLCPSVIKEPSDEDRNHNVHADYCTLLFHDLPYLLGRVGSIENRNVLALVKSPTAKHLDTSPGDNFVLRGFEILDVHGGISALTNCGGFDRAFRNDELNEFGLLNDLDRAIEVQRVLWSEYPDEPHARCHVWAIWRREPTST